MSQRYIGGLIYNPPGGFSGSFDGSGDYLTVADSATLEPGSSDFTFECWVFPTATGSYLGVFSKRATNGVYGPIQVLINNGTMEMAASTSGSSWAVVATASSSPALNTWSHIAVVRNGTASNNLVLYLNGVSVATGSVSSTALFDNSGAWAIGADAAAGTGAFAGYISNFRYVKGSAVYTAAFTPPNGPLQAVTNTQLLTCAYSTFRDGSTNNFTITVNGNTAVSTQNPFPLTTLPNPALGNQGNGVYSMSQYQSLLSQNLWPAVDPYWRYVTLMLHGNGTNGAQNNTFLDSSTNNFTITRNGNTTQGTFAPYGSNWSNYFDGTGDYITSSQSQTIPATGDFTIDGWFWCNTYTNYPSILSQGTSGNAGRFNIYINNDGKFGVQIGATSSNIGSAVPTNQWVHFAVTRSGSTVTVYINGASIGTATNGTSIQNTTPSIGSEWSGDPYRWIGYLSNIRVSNVVRTISLPASPFVADANTVLLTCQSNRFIDTSTTAATLTPNGNVSIQRFSPFAPTAPYAAGTDGGSGYFDGSGDYLAVANDNVFDTNSTFTLECWYYQPASGNATFFSRGGGTADWNTSTGHQFLFFIDAGTLYWMWNNSGTNTQISTTAPSPNQWHHIAVGYNGTTTRFWLNGASVGSSTTGYTLPTTRNIIRAGLNPSNQNPLTGYLSGLRFVKGTDVYGVSNTSITVPTAPLTAITNTSLLLNFTNAGIIDNAEMNNLETVGNAQISTAQSKFGGASMLFDGSGDRLYEPSNQNFNFGTGDFTIEFWVNPISQGGHGSSNNDCLIDFRPGSNGVYGTLYIYSNGTGVYWYVNSANRITGGAISNSVWTHIAVCRASGSTRLFLNGTQSGSTYTDSNNYLVSPIMIGEFNDGTGGGNFNGYMDDLRITKGYARYTTSFTPQRSQWQDQ